MKTLIVAEHDNQVLKKATYHAVTAALQLKSDIDILVAGYQCEKVITEAQKLPGIKRVFTADAKEYQHQLAENTAAFIAETAVGYDYLLAAATTFGKNILPRAAALLDTAMIADVIQIISADTFVRPIYAGNALATLQSSELLKVLTVRTTAFPAAKCLDEPSVSVEVLTKMIPNDISQFKNHELTKSERPELTGARIIIAGGRGLKSADNFKLLEKLADKLGAAIGASRAAVDAGFAPNDYQVGQTGKIVAPDLYIAIGISGAIQHLAGMKDSKVVVAINSDPDAAIFAVADYGLVADLFTVLPELEKEI